MLERIVTVRSVGGYVCPPLPGACAGPIINNNNKTVIFFGV